MSDLGELYKCVCCGTLSGTVTCYMCRNINSLVQYPERARAMGSTRHAPLAKRPRYHELPAKKRHTKREVKFPMMLMSKSRPWSGILPDHGPPKTLYLKGNRTPCREKMLQREADKPGQKLITEFMSK